MKSIIFFLVAWLAIISSCVNASDNTENEAVGALAQTVAWRRLLAFGVSNKSAIKNPEFFLSPSGMSDPLAELDATLLAFSQPLVSADDHPQCKFPGRYLWLSRHLDLSKYAIAAVDCPEFNTFREQGRADSLSLIFATGYLGNPASYYGHLLLKINTSEKSGVTALENTAVNFGANVPADENMLLYIVKGIMGGYNSSFTQQKYHYHLHNYGESEQRDLWEYELDLDEEDMALLIAHQWEIMGADYTYYFFNRNCAYRMGELLELVSAQRVVSSLSPWSTPQAVVQDIGRMQYKGRPFVKHIRYHPSRQSKLYKGYQLLSREERAAVDVIVAAPDKLDGEEIAALAQISQFKVVDVLIDYYQFVRKEDDGNKDPNNELYRRVLSKRYSLPPGNVTKPFLSANQPQLGRKPSYINLSVSSLKNQDEVVNIWIRPAYYDSLDSSYGHIKNAALSMGEVALSVDRDSVYIRQFNLVKIESLRTNTTGLPRDRNNSWYLDVGAAQVNLACQDCLAFKLRSGYGYATSTFNDHLIVAGYAGAGYLSEAITNSGAYASASVAAHLNISDSFRMRVDLERREFYGGTLSDIYNMQARFRLSPQMDMRIQFAHDEERELGVGVGFYW